MEQTTQSVQAIQAIQFDSSHFIALLPILIISATIVISMLSIAWKRNQTITAAISSIGMLLSLLALIPAVKLVNQIGIIDVTEILSFDKYAYFASLSIILVTLACTSFAYIYLEGFKGNKDEFYLLLLLSTLGGMILVSTRHLLGLFIGLELLSIPMYGLVGYAFFNRQSLEASIKYMVLSAVGSGFLLFGMALTFAITGQLTFLSIEQAFNIAGHSVLIDLGIILMIVGLSFKLSLVPFHLWTPDVYQGAPAPASAFLATASKLAIFALLIRFMEYIPIQDNSWIYICITVLAIASILVGNLLALFQNSLKRILGYSSIAHFGYLLILLLASNELADLELKELAAQTTTIYLFTYIATTLGAFSVITVLSSPCQERDADALYRYRGLFWRRPLLTISLSVMMLSLAGVPLTAGFIGKFWLLMTANKAGLWLLIAMVILGSSIALYYYLRVMITLYLPEPTARDNEEKNMHWSHFIATIVLLLIAIIVIFIGVYPSPLIAISEFAGIPATLIH